MAVPQDCGVIEVSQTYSSSLGSSSGARPRGASRRRHSRVAALGVMAAIAISAGLLSHFHTETQLRASLGDASVAMTPAGPLAYFPR